MKVELVDHTHCAEEKIATYAAICYDADTSEDANARRISKLLNLNHLAVLRFAKATFLVEGISRACSHQFVRHKFLDFLQESQRYVKLEDGHPFVYPGTTEDFRISGAYQRAVAVYHDLLKAGVKKEDARLVLPQGVSTRLYVTGSFQAWHDFLYGKASRLDKSAQWEIRAVAEEIQKQLNKIAPNIFKGNQ